MRIHGAAVVFVTALVLGLPAPVFACEADTPVAASMHQTSRTIPVSGSGVHYFNTAIIHSVVPTANGIVQRSTDTVELGGDLTGRILYHPLSEFDFVNGTLVNSGHQVFSGTIAGSAPVLLFDDEFRFEVDLNSGEMTGEVYLVDSLAGPKIRCHLAVVGTEMDGDGNATFAYEGECRFRGADWQ
jgi:hypothetical protein